MYARTMLLVVTALCLSPSSPTTSSAQGGWDVWTVELRDGTRLEAAPVWSLDEKELRFGFGGGGAGKGTAVKHSQLRLMSNNLGNSRYRADKGADYVPPAPPEGDFGQDLVVLDDGRWIFGTVLIRAGVGKSGGVDIYGPVLIQHGAEVSLTRVAYIKFATRLDKPKSKRSRRPRRPTGSLRAAPETSTVSGVSPAGLPPAQRPAGRALLTSTRS